LPANATGTVAVATTSTYIGPYLTPTDPNRIYRVVGFSEYSTALEYFDTLVPMCSSEELAAIDELIASEPQYTVYTNLSRRYNVPLSSLSLKPSDAQDEFARRGLRWMTALARTEVGAALAGFTQHPRPFEQVAGPGYDREEVKQLLLDAAQMHYWSLKNDPTFRLVLKKFTPDARTLTYIRRLNVATAFVNGTAQYIGKELNAKQWAQLRSQAKDIHTTRLALRSALETFLKLATTVDSKQIGKAQLLNLCRDGICQKTDSPF
jgi:hypothetical protein